MSSSFLTIIFAFADSTNKNFTVGPFSPSSSAVRNFKSRVKSFNDTDTESGKKITNLADILKSDGGAAFSGIKTAYIVTSQTRRIFDAATYGG